MSIVRAIDREDVGMGVSPSGGDGSEIRDAAGTSRRLGPSGTTDATGGPEIFEVFESPGEHLGTRGDSGVGDPSDWCAEVRARIAWLLVPGVGPTRCRRLADAPGGAAAMLEAPVSEVAATLRRSLDAATRWQQAARRSDVEAELRRTAAASATIVPLGGPAYPPLLAAIPDPPPLLWIQGRSTPRPATAAERMPTVAIVGTRRPTAYGLETAARFGEGLASCGIAIVSGGARGIDAAAHRAALRVGGATIAVLGSGLARRYPPEHDRLFDEIVSAGGAILGEWPMATEPRPGHFPRRNRIVSGLSLGVVVVEAARRSGALITARLAVEEHGREAMAVPGRIDMPQSAGCLKAIREGWAAPVASLAEIGEQLSGAGGLIAGAGARAAAGAIAATGGTASPTTGDGAAGDAGEGGGGGGDGPLDGTIVEIVARHRGDRSGTVDAIVAETGLAAAEVASRLVRLRLAGRLVE